MPEWKCRIEDANETALDEDEYYDDYLMNIIHQHKQTNKQQT